MKSVFKFLFIVLGVGCISIISIIGIIYVDENNLMVVFLEKAPANTKAYISEHTHEARLSFSMPHDDRPIVVDISEKNSNDVEYQYIYPSQIFYATSTDISLLFRDSVFHIPNNIGLKSITERLKNANETAYIFTQSYVINRAAIVGIRREEKRQPNNYSYFVRLLNDEELPISKDIYKQLTDKIELAKPDFSF